MMRWKYAVTGLVLAAAPAAFAQPDHRQLVELPPMMQQHMLMNMRDHLATLDEILAALAANQPDKAAELAERRLGMSSLASHGAEHMAPHMPQEMREIGTGMHRAASRFALTAQEGDLLRAYAALRNVTASCVACHEAYRIR
ncbi:MAG: hypothetical protein WC383_16820 [Gammaproteobacteria bacterium]